ncbi:MAG: phosphatase PAP2 family protein, partial [Deltaproteobacteria bacterium]|nr:phosphatase PAP2 family protein [Deltaproteobacteria bacterium]
PLAALIGWLVWQEGRSVLWLLAGMALLLLLTDAATAHLWRPLLARSRPYAFLENVHVYVDGLWQVTDRLYLASAATSYGLPSAHAANSFGLAIYLARFYRRLGLALVVIALVIGFSRVYLGRHYPGDVLVGYLWGAASGLAVAWLTNRLKTRFRA